MGEARFGDATTAQRGTARASDEEPEAAPPRPVGLHGGRQQKEARIIEFGPAHRRRARCRATSWCSDRRMREAGRANAGCEQHRWRRRVGDRCPRGGIPGLVRGGSGREGEDDQQHEDDREGTHAQENGPCQVPLTQESQKRSFLRQGCKAIFCRLARGRAPAWPCSGRRAHYAQPDHSVLPLEAA